MTYLHLTAIAWSVLAASALGLVIHTATETRRLRAFNSHVIDAILLTAPRCYPVDVDGVALCGECDRLWAPGRHCPVKGERS